MSAAETIEVKKLPCEEQEKVAAFPRTFAKAFERHRELLRRVAQ